jgi:glycosyltransferase involved in cell wall biosynthesis
MKKALTIHASRFYSLIYPRKYRQLVLENKPNIDAKAVGYSPGKPLRIAYLGNIRYLNILKNLADALRGDERFVLYYHGGGPDFLTLREYVSGESNIIMTGSYRYDDIEHLYANADIIWSAYPNRDFNVRYAISNKFHESLAYAVPAIYAGNTCLGEYASSNGLGFQVNPYDVESIRCLLNEIVSDSQRLVQMSASLRHQYAEETSWQEDFMKVKKEVDAFFSRH